MSGTSVPEFLNDLAHLLKMVRTFINDGYVPKEMVCGALFYILHKYLSDIDVFEGEGDVYALASIYVPDLEQRLVIKIEHAQDKPRIVIELEKA